jgi:SAM-dependent methyltransferase
MSRYPDLYDWERMRDAWSHPPVEGFGYLSADEMLGWDDDRLRATIALARADRYGGWRNDGGRWVSQLHRRVDGKDVLDFGCGFGLEALALAEAGARVTLADIAPANVELAARVLELNGQAWHAQLAVSRFWPFVDTSARFDIFYANGVIHHIPWADGVMERAHQLLRRGGEARLMVYTAEAWRQATGTEPPPEVTRHPAFDVYVRHMDGVGGYADYYTMSRLIDRFGRWFAVTRWVPLGPAGTYAAATLHPL